jgi:mannose-1-phosphate guanylyltransferase
MKLILLSGGSGKRLWPLSNDTRSKQFLKVLKGPEGELESMVQRVWRQLRTTGFGHDSYIATGKGQLDMIQSQIGLDVPVILEPERRDTFPAIALAAVYLYSIEGVSVDEVVTVLPVDPYVEEPFFGTLRKLEAAIRHSGAEYALMGVTPGHPSEKYGYIVPKAGPEMLPLGYKTVSHFSEKPKEEQASELMEQGALWNCGVFAFRLNTIIELLIRKGLPIQYEEMLKRYHMLPKISFDYEVLEPAKAVTVVPFNGVWKDLGTWNTLTEEVEHPVIGKGSISSDSRNTHLINELEIPVAVMGVSNVIVSVSPDGILVADKETSVKVKEMIQGLEQRPMYEERRWGSYRVLDYKRYPDGREVLTKRICISAGHNLSYQQHFKRSEVWTVVSGSGEAVLDGRITLIDAGDVIKVPVGMMHSIRAQEDLEIIEVQAGGELIEEDIYRLCLSWDEITSHCV